MSAAASRWPGRVLIVGAGLAGLRAAERLRERGVTTAITVVGDEPHRPYNRTPLSKQLLTGSQDITDLGFGVWADLDLTYRLGVPAAALDTTARALTLADGSVLEFDSLLLATGTAARELPGAPHESPHVWMLRTLEDARAIDAALAERAGHVVIVGGGFIGCEVATSARERGHEVTIVDVSTALLTHSLGHQVGDIVGGLHRDHGVTLRLGVGVTGWHPHGTGVSITLADGTALDADCAVVGVGTTPNTGWLTGSGLDTSDGILATEELFAAGPDDLPLEHVVVAGDVLRWPNSRYDMVPRRVEHWINAVESAQHAAESLCLGPARAHPFTPVPRFWSEQHGVKIQSAGVPALGPDIAVVEGDVARRRFVAAYCHQGRLMGVVGFDSPRRVIHYTEQIGLPFDLGEKASRSVA